jgi:hypothetical protein
LQATSKIARFAGHKWINVYCPTFYSEYPRVGSCTKGQMWVAVST